MFESYVKPANRKSWPKAQEIHGISPEQVAGAPSFDKVLPQMMRTIGRRHVVIYNARYDCKLMMQSILKPENR